MATKQTDYRGLREGQIEPKLAQSLLATVGDVGRGPFLGENSCHQLAKRTIVVDDKDLFFVEPLTRRPNRRAPMGRPQ